MTAEILHIESSAVFLPKDKALRRLPRAPGRPRPQKFWDQFEDRALFYDCFWSADKSCIWLVGPPPLSLAHHVVEARFVAEPSGKSLSTKAQISRSIMAIRLAGAPPDTAEISFRFAGQDFALKVRPNLADAFAGRRVISTMNKDNDLDWIALWADWHQKRHGADAVIVFDNGSTGYRIEDIEARLVGVPGLKTIAVLDWPWRYGPHDPAVIFHRFWANFLQVAGLYVLLRRFASSAEGILNCDIDELVGRGQGASVFDLAKTSPKGLVRLAGTWVECAVGAKPEGPLHLGYRYREKNPLKARCADKWVLDPARNWVSGSSIFPMMHRLYGVPKSWSAKAPAAPFWHFKPINTNWKSARRTDQAIDLGRHVRLEALDAEVDAYLDTGAKAPSP